jgi:hypothetical protein
MTTYAEVGTRARVDVNDTVATYRTSDATLLGFIKDGIKEMVPFRPDLFKVEGSITCTAGSMEQTIPNAPRSVAIIDVYTASYGAESNAIAECELEILRRSRPSYRTDAADTATDWGRYPAIKGKRDDRKFFVYPKAPTGQVLTACWSEAPDMDAITTSTWTTDDLPITDELVGALTEYVKHRCENQNEEPAIRARALEYKANFMALLGVSAQQKD